MKIQVINAEPIMLVLVSANNVNYFDILPPYEHQSIAGKLILMLMPMRKGRKKGPNERSCYRILFVTLKVAWSSMAQPAKWITNETWVQWSDSDQKRTGKILSPISKSAFAFYVIFGQPSLSKLSPSLCRDIYMRSGKLMSIKNLISRILYPMLLYSVNVWQSVV